MGLVDPGSHATQDWETTRTKVTNGKTMLSIWSWWASPAYVLRRKEQGQGVGLHAGSA